MINLQAGYYPALARWAGPGPLLRAALCLRVWPGQNLFHRFTSYDSTYPAIFMSMEFKTILNHFLNFNQLLGTNPIYRGEIIDRQRVLPVYLGPAFEKLTS